MSFLLCTIITAAGNKFSWLRRSNNKTYSEDFLPTKTAYICTAPPRSYITYLSFTGAILKDDSMPLTAYNISEDKETGILLKWWAGTLSFEEEEERHHVLHEPAHISSPSFIYVHILYSINAYALALGGVLKPEGKAEETQRRLFLEGEKHLLSRPSCFWNPFSAYSYCFVFFQIDYFCFFF